MLQWTKQMMEDVHVLMATLNLVLLALIVWLHARMPTRKP